MEVKGEDIGAFDVYLVGQSQAPQVNAKCFLMNLGCSFLQKSLTYLFVEGLEPLLQ